jgi:dimeric dUTPase (all-alpha-NTP-PPase superfamily)
MFEHQLRLQVRLGSFKKIKDEVTRQLFIDRMLLACHEELGEIARETLTKDNSMPFGWKQCEFHEQKYKDEIIDLWIFTMNLWLAVGGTPQEFFDLYCEKNKLNHKRQDNNGKY